MRKLTTWRTEITNTLSQTRDKFEDLTIAIDDGELDREFYDGYGGSEGAPFTAWSDNWVYFPVVYGGAEWVGCVPRNPCDKKTNHVGGE